MKSSTGALYVFQDICSLSPEEMDAHLALHDIIDSAKADMQEIWAELAINGIVG